MKNPDSQKNFPKHHVSTQDFFEDSTLRIGTITFFPVGGVDPEHQFTYKFRWKNWDMPGESGNIVTCELIKGDKSKHAELIEHQYGEGEYCHVVSAVFSMWHVYHRRVSGYSIGPKPVELPLPFPGLGGNPKSEFVEKPTTGTVALVTT